MIKQNDSKQAQESLDKFHTWSASLSKADFIAIARGAKLSRKDVAKGAGIARSTLNDNVLVKKELLVLEKNLRADGVLAKLAEGVSDELVPDGPTLYDQTADEFKRLKIEVERLKTLCLRQDAEIERLRAKLLQFAEISDVLSDTGLMPR